MAKGKATEQTPYLCPIARFFRDLEKGFGKKSKFRDHLNRSRIEFLKALRSLVDERIKDLEKGASEQGGKKVTKIKVE